MSDHAALCSLLVRKGVITYHEYYESLVEFMEREVKSYSDSLSAQYGTRITLK